MASYLSTSLIEIHNASANSSLYIGSALNSSQHGMSRFGWAISYGSGRCSQTRLPLIWTRQKLNGFPGY